MTHVRNDGLRSFADWTEAKGEGVQLKVSGRFGRKRMIRHCEAVCGRRVFRCESERRFTASLITRYSDGLTASHVTRTGLTGALNTWW